jgi:hypothetical protein
VILIWFSLTGSAYGHEALCVGEHGSELPDGEEFVPELLHDL